MDRLHKLAPGLGFRAPETLEIASQSNAAEEAELVRRRLPEGAIRVLCDERGKSLPSTDLATRLSRWRDDGAPALAVCIGGADGWDPAFRKEASLLYGFGQQTWPHRLARVLAAEQLYRAATILAGTPYHREG